MFNHSTEPYTKVKMISALSLHGLEKEVNAFGAKNKIQSVSISSNTPSTRYFAAVTYVG